MTPFTTPNSYGKPIARAGTNPLQGFYKNGVCHKKRSKKQHRAGITMGTTSHSHIYLPMQARQRQTQGINIVVLFDCGRSAQKSNVTRWWYKIELWWTLQVASPTSPILKAARFSICSAPNSGLYTCVCVFCLHGWQSAEPNGKSWKMNVFCYGRFGHVWYFHCSG